MPPRRFENNMPTAVDYINKHLKRQYGNDLMGRPIFRIVWSEDLTEKRFAFYDNMISEHIILNTIKKLKEVKKYANPIYKDRWILEKLILDLPNPELWDSVSGQGSYEPIWVFRGPNDTYQAPTIKAVDFVMRMLLSDKVRRNQAMEDSDDQAALESEIAECQELLGSTDGDVASHLHSRSGSVGGLRKDNF